MSTENKFRGRLFGGFNRQDVVNYIERTAQVASDYKASKEALEDRCDELAKQLEEEKSLNSSLKAECSKSDEELSDLSARISGLENENSTLRETITARDNEIAGLSQRLTACDETIGVYENSKERIALLELNASRRAVNIEKAAEDKADDITRKCLELVASLREEYEKACNDTDSTTAHIRGELDRIGTQLFDLSEQLAGKVELFNKLDYMINHGME